MNNAAQAKKLLEQALGCLPNGHASENTRIHIKRAISELFHAEQRQVKHFVQQSPNWRLDPQSGETISPAEAAARARGARNAMMMLDEMYAKEEEKLKKMDTQNRHEEEDGGSDLGPILG